MITTRKITSICIFSIILIASSCIREAYNITCKSVVVDEETHIPISQSIIQSSCTYQQNIDKSSSETLVTNTDSLGVFKVNFAKGYKISMIIGGKDYMENRLNIYPGSEVLPDTIYLKKKMYLETFVTKPKKAITLQSNFE